MNTQYTRINRRSFLRGVGGAMMALPHLNIGCYRKISSSADENGVRGNKFWLCTEIVFPD